MPRHTWRGVSLVHITQVPDVPRLPVVDWQLGNELEELVRHNAPGGWVNVMAYGRGFNAPGLTVEEVREKVGDREDEVITLHINANSWENEGSDKRILDARILTADSPEAGGGIQTTDKTLFHHYQQELVELTERAAKRAGGAVPARVFGQDTRPAWVVRIPKPKFWVEHGSEISTKTIIGVATALIIALVLWALSLLT